MDRSRSRSTSSGTQRPDRTGPLNTNDNILLEFGAFKCIKHTVESGFKIIPGDIVKIEIKANVHDIALKPVVQMIVYKVGGNIAHPLQMD